jgi:alpha-ketoglutarate-dependent 2,4-dichlorophenoxyacetate dioxygenase
MTLDIRPLHPIFAAEARGFDFSAPADSWPMGDVTKAIDAYGVLVFRNERPPTDEQHIAFSKLLGPIEQGNIIKVSGFDRRRVRYMELVDVGNIDPDGNIFPPDHRRMLFRKGDRLWHADMSFMENRATWSMLVGHEIPPEGGDTEFVDARAVFEALPREMQALCESLTVEHSIWRSRTLAGFPPPTAEELASRAPVRHPLVHAHRSGRKSLYIASHASHVVGWPYDLGRDLLDSLTKFATQPKFVYRHEWRLGDMLMWDNLSTLHRATEFEDSKYRRDMRRTTCREREIVGAEAGYA